MKIIAGFILLLIAEVSFAQTHFNAVESTGLPYQIIVTNATINGSPIVSGTEIGLFDDTLCVGSGLFNGEYNLSVIAWEASSANNLPGFRVGYTILFKFWSEVNNEWIEIDANPTFQNGNGLFGSGIYSVVELHRNLTSVSKNNRTDNISIDIYPNPAVKNVNISLQFVADGNYSIGVYNLLGELIYSIENGSAYKVIKTFMWNGKANSGSIATSGIYLLVLKSNKQILSKKFLFIK